MKETIFVSVTVFTLFLVTGVFASAKAVPLPLDPEYQSFTGHFTDGRDFVTGDDHGLLAESDPFPKLVVIQGKLPGIETAGFFTNGAVGAQSKDPCAKYYGRGYCVDLIKERLGRRPSGNPATWRGNVPTDQGKSGDALTFRAPIPWGHTSLVVRPVYAAGTARIVAYDVVEYNYGSKWVDRACAVTDKFGVATNRRVPVSSVAAIWRA